MSSGELKAIFVARSEQNTDALNKMVFIEWKCKEGVFFASIEELRDSIAESEKLGADPEAVRQLTQRSTAYYCKTVEALDFVPQGIATLSATVAKASPEVRSQLFWLEDERVDQCVALLNLLLEGLQNYAHHYAADIFVPDHDQPVDLAAELEVVYAQPLQP